MTLDLDHGLSLMRQLLAEDRYLAVLITTRPHCGEPQVAMVNASIIDDPVDGRPVIALANLRGQPKAGDRPGRVGMGFGLQRR